MLETIITIVLCVAILIYTLIRALPKSDYDNTGEEEFERRMKERYPDFEGL